MVHAGGGNTHFLPSLGMAKGQMLSDSTGMGAGGFLGSSFQFFGVFVRAGAAQTAGEGVLQDMVQAANPGTMVGAGYELRSQFQSIACEVSASFSR
jgi:hypothetical protein